MGAGLAGECRLDQVVMGKIRSPPRHYEHLLVVQTSFRRHTTPKLKSLVGRRRGLVFA